MKHFIRRSLLFFPATRPDRFEKAIATGVDSVCMDLEDAVSSERKDEARDSVLKTLKGDFDGTTEIVLRVNSIRTPTGLRDILGINDNKIDIHSIMIPKVESPDEVRMIDAILSSKYGDIQYIPMIETPKGLERVEEIATSSHTVTALLFGGVDLSTELGSTMEWDALLYARSRIVAAARSAGIDIFDTVYLSVSDIEGLQDETKKAKHLGFTGKSAIHPSQIPVIHEVFTPSEEEIDEAKKILRAYEENRKELFLLDGKLIEPPVIKKAERIVAIADATK